MHRKRQSYVVALCAALVAIGATTAASADDADAHSSCATACVEEFSLQPAPAGPFGIAVGPHGDVWFSHGDRLGRMTPDGRERDLAVPTADPGLGWLARNGDTMWFAERTGNAIGRVAADGSVREFPIPTGNRVCGSFAGASSVPQGIAFGTHGDVWFTEQCGNKIGRLSHNHITEFDIPTASAQPLGLAAARDGSFWFTERGADHIGRITPDGTIDEFPISPGSGSQRIVAGPDGALWFTELGGGRVGRVTENGSLSEIQVAGGGVGPGITVGPDGALWFVRFGQNRLTRMTTGGTVTADVALPAAGAIQLTAGHNSLWVAQGFGQTAGEPNNHVARVTPGTHDDD